MPLPQPDVELYVVLDRNDTPKLTFRIPRSDFAAYTFAPLKWLRYLGFVVHGREGILRGSRRGPEVNYMCAVEALQDRYYFTSDDEPRLIDPKAMDDRTSSTFSTESRTGFAASVAAHDENRCIVTNAVNLNPNVSVVACHIIPHSKGSDYIQYLSAHRGSDRDLIDDINDVRNGIFLFSSLHTYVSSRTMAFLRTPNFAMSADDVPRSASVAGPASDAMSRVTVQFFSEIDIIMASSVSQNCDVICPTDTLDWPPPMIFDIVYGVAALKKWGKEETIDLLCESVKDIYGRLSERSKQVQEDRAKERAKRGKQRAKEKRKEPDLFDLLLCLWVKNSRSGPSVEASEQEESSRKVEAWLGTQ